MWGRGSTLKARTYEGTQEGKGWAGAPKICDRRLELHRKMCSGKLPVTRGTQISSMYLCNVKLGSEPSAKPSTHIYAMHNQFGENQRMSELHAWEGLEVKAENRYRQWNIVRWSHYGGTWSQTVRLAAPGKAQKFGERHGPSPGWGQGG